MQVRGKNLSDAMASRLEENKRTAKVMKILPITRSDRTESGQAEQKLVPTCSSLDRYDLMRYICTASSVASEVL